MLIASNISISNPKSTWGGPLLHTSQHLWVLILCSISIAKPTPDGTLDFGSLPDTNHPQEAPMGAYPSSTSKLPAALLEWVLVRQEPVSPHSPLPKAMAPRGSLLLLLALLLLVTHCPGQHWSHGWFPGGKRDLGTPPARQVGRAPGRHPP